MPFQCAQTSLEGAQQTGKLYPYVDAFAKAKTAALCLGCNLLLLPERCVEREGVVVCDQCEGV